MDISFLKYIYKIPKNTLKNAHNFIVTWVELGNSHLTWLNPSKIVVHNNVFKQRFVISLMHAPIAPSFVTAEIAHLGYNIPQVCVDPCP